MMVQVVGKYVDFKSLKKIFSDNREVMEQVMLGLILTAHEKAPDLKRNCKNEDWDKASETIAFIKSAYKHISTVELLDQLKRLEELIDIKQTTKELQFELDNFGKIASLIIQDIEFYLAEE